MGREERRETTETPKGPPRSGIACGSHEPRGFFVSAYANAPCPNMGRGRWHRLGDFVRTQRERRSRSGTFPDLLFDIFYIRLGKALRGELFLEVVCNDHMVAVPDDFPYESIHEQFANLDVVGILKDFGKQEFLHFLDGQVSV